LIIWCIPGIFGFLVWELRENWRLYAANRPKGLRPMIIGSHGEPMGRLLRPGFHSGTIPKLFAKLRRAERKARKTGNWKAVRKHLHGFEHIETMVRRYIERDFLALFNGSRRLDHLAISREGEAPAEPIEMQDVPATTSARQEPRPTDMTATGLALLAMQLSTNRLRLIFSAAASDQPLLAIDFEVQSGWLISSLVPIDAKLIQSEDDRDELLTAILGLYKTAGVEVVRQQLETAFSFTLPAYELSAQGLRIWPDSTFESEVFYEFRDEPDFTPHVVHGVTHRPLPTLYRCKVLYHEQLLAWQSWVSYWGAVTRGAQPRAKDFSDIPMLPLEK
jgi:hypothetical protein